MISKANYDCLFNDERLERRGEQLLQSLFQTGSHSIQSIAESRAEQKAYYRLLRNEKVNETALIKELTDRCKHSSKGKVVLAIQDSSEINLSKHRNRIHYDESLGTINDNNDGIGFKIHPSLVINAHTHFPYGYSSINIWARPHEKRDISLYEHSRLDISEKETGVWMESNESTYENLKEAKSVIIVQDREGDFYEQFASARQDGKFFLLIRSNHNRLLSDGIKLWDYIDNQPVIGSYQANISTQTKGKPRREREATIDVKIGKVNLKRPHKKSHSLAPTSVELTVIEAREANNNNEDAVLWRLYTTWPVNSFGAACEVIEWYRCRWYIEEVFKVLKKECFNIEGSELESGWAVRKLTIMMLDTIIKLFQLAIAYNTPENELPDTTAIFNPEEEILLETINQQLQGKTEKLSNPFNKAKMPWAFWILARLGGWKGYTTQRKPGYATLIKGLKKFYLLQQGFIMQKNVGTQ